MKDFPTSYNSVTLSRTMLIERAFAIACLPFSVASGLNFGTSSIIARTYLQTFVLHMAHALNK